ncbi:hypothetical protein EYE35_01030 [Cereibacter sphaeroides]|nr:hypothetical protein EYE35_01030 [Cereibacter sphaeroides]
MSATDRIWVDAAQEDPDNGMVGWAYASEGLACPEYLARDGETVTALVEALREATEVVHKAFVAATMESVNAGPSHPLAANFDKWRVRCANAEERARAALAKLEGR